MGIGIVIILLIIGLLFFFQFSNLDDESDKYKIDDRRMATTMISSMMKTTTGTQCDNQDIWTLIKDCVDNLETDGNIICSGDPSCIFLSNTLDEVFIKPVLESQGKDYIFNITNIETGEEFIRSSMGNNCDKPRAEIISSSTLIVDGNLRRAIPRLIICY